MELSGMSDDLQPALTPSEHQAARLAALPALYKTQPERLCYDLVLAKAIGETEEAVFALYDYTPEQALALLESPGFSALLDRVAKDLHENGLTFKAKARAQSDALLEHSFEIATDPMQPTAERVKLIQWTARMAGHEKGLDKDDGKGTSSGFSLSITFAGQEPMRVVQNEPATIEQK